MSIFSRENVFTNAKASALALAVLLAPVWLLSGSSNAMTCVMGCVVGPYLLDFYRGITDG